MAKVLYNQTTCYVCWAAKYAEEKKYEHYVDLLEPFLFIPVAIETSVVLGKGVIKLINAIGSKITEVNNEKKATSYPFQSLSTTVQRGNFSSVLGTYNFTFQELKRLKRLKCVIYNGNGYQE